MDATAIPRVMSTTPDNLQGKTKKSKKLPGLVAQLTKKIRQPQ
jgi:hypothetical protein